MKLYIEYTPWWKSASILLAAMALRNILACNVKRLRSERGLSQEALADVIGIDRTYVSALERERYSASIDMLERLAEGLEVQPCELISSSDFSRV